MKKNLLHTLFILLAFVQLSQGQITITGPTTTKMSSPFNNWGSWVQDPLDNSGKVWEIPDYYSNVVREYSSISNMLANNVSTTYYLPFNFAGTGHAVYGGYLYFNKAYSNNLVKYNLATQSVVLDVPLTGAGSMNIYPYQWGGYSDIDFAIDETGFYVMYSTAANSGNMVISKLDPNTLLPISTFNTNSTKNCGDAFMVGGISYHVATYWNINNTINYQYNTLTSTGSVIAVPFTNGGGYLTSLVYNPSTHLLFAWNSGSLYTYTVGIINTITNTLSITSSSICAGTAIDVEYTATGSYTAPNTFTAQLSNAAGSFASGVTNIGTLSGPLNGVINAFIPALTPNGAGYRIRVIGDNPATYGSDNGYNLFISNINPTVTIAGSFTPVCYGTPLSYTASGASSYSWSNGYTSSNVVIIASGNKTYTVTGSNGICSTNTTVVVSLLPMPNLTGSGNSELCPGASTNISVSGADTYSWTHGPTTSAIFVTPTVSTVYTAIGTSTMYPCAAYKSISVFIKICNGLFDVANENLNFKVYPNPSNAEFFVELKNGSNKQIEVMDMTGKVIMKQNSSNDKIKIDLNDFANGIYFLKIQSENSVEKVKLIKH